LLKILFCIIFGFSFAGQFAFTQSDSGYIYIPYWEDPIQVDGDLSEWKRSHTIIFTDTLSRLHSVPEQHQKTLYPLEFDQSLVIGSLSKNRVVVQTCWNFHALNVGITVYDQHLFAEIAMNDDHPMIHVNDAIEIYIDTKFDSDSRIDINDYQFLIDILNNSVVLRGDRRLMKLDTVATPKDYGQNILFSSAVQVYGTINDTLPDSCYIVEISIPFAAIGIVPQTGMQFSMDICNDDMDHTLVNAVTEADYLARIWPFNWSGVSDFGFPAHWKTAELTGEPSWLEALAGNHKKSWLLIYFFSSILVIGIIIILIVRLRHYSHMPSFEDVQHIKFIYLKDENAASLGEQLSIEQKHLQRITDHIVSHKSDAVRTEELAESVGLSVRNLQRITKNELNCTPVNFVRMIKVKLAAEYLRHPQYSIAEVAYDHGFTDPAYFSRTFKRHFNMSPSEYRENLIENVMN